jgi:hypothetical protein
MRDHATMDSKTIAWEIFLHLAYLDDSGTDPKSPVTLCGAVIVQPESFLSLENLHDAAALVLPLEKSEEFEEFKGCELYHGTGIFKGIEESKRFQAIRILLTSVRVEKFPYIYFALDSKKLAQSATGSAKALDVAFRMCLLGIEEWAQKNHPSHPDAISLNLKDFFLCVMDDTADSALKNQLRTSYRTLRAKRPYTPPKNHRLWHAHDDLYFGDSKESVGLQIADLCNYFMLRHLCGPDDEEGFYRMFGDQAICAKAEPEFTTLKSLAKIHVPPPKDGATSS